MIKTENRIGQSKMMKCNKIGTIIEYNNAMDIIVQFSNPLENIKAEYTQFKRGTILSKYHPTQLGVGYLGNSKTVDSEGKDLKSYICWCSMIRRCYSDKYKSRNPSYLDCYVCEEWKSYEIFKVWYDLNYYIFRDEVTQLDKDIIKKNNKIYSPENCVFVPQIINSMFTKSNKTRGSLPIGVSITGRNKDKYSSRSMYVEHNKITTKSIQFNNIEDAFNNYKHMKENIIKSIADLYKNEIPIKLYDAMNNYTVEITD